MPQQEESNQDGMAHEIDPTNRVNIIHLDICTTKET